MPSRPSSSSVVVCRRLSSTFHLKRCFIPKKRLDHFFPFWYEASLGIILKVIYKGQKGQIWLIFQLYAIFAKLFDNVFPILA